MELLEVIWGLIKDAWEKIKKLLVKVLNFLKSITNWFKDPARIKIIQEKKSHLAVVIKEKLENGEYNVVNCLFDEDNGVLVDETEHALILRAEQLDEETSRQFGDRDMLVLR